MSDSVGKINLDLGIDYNGFNKELNGIAGKASSMASGAFKKLGFAIAGAFTVKKLIDFSKAAIGIASDLAEVQNVVDVVFGSMNEDINSFAKNALQQFGLSELSAKKYASTMGAMLKSSGLAGAQVRDMSKDITGLAADMASFYNLNQDEAFNKIRSGISGETEPLKQLGINMSVANMEAFALSRGIQKSYNAMSQSEQILLRYNYLLETTKDAQGDFARTSSSWSNQTKLLGEQFKSLQAIIGQGLINVLTPVLQMLNSLIQKLQVAAEYFKRFTEIVMGLDKTSADATKSASSMADSTAGVGDSVKATAKAIKGAVSGYDELNIIAKDASGTMEDMKLPGMGDMPTGAAAPEVTVPPIDTTQFDLLKQKLDGIRQSMTGMGQYFAQQTMPQIKQAIEQIKPQLQAWRDSLGKVFNDSLSLVQPFIDSIKVSVIPAMSESIPIMSGIFSGLLETARTVFDGIWQAAFPVLQWFSTNGLPFLTSFGMGVLQIFSSMFNTVKGIFDTLWEGAVQPGLNLLSEMVVDALDGIKAFWDKWGTGIVTGITGVFDNIKKIFNNLWKKTLEPIVSNMLKSLKELWDKHLKGMFEAIGEFIGKLVTGVTEIFNKFIAPIVNYLVDVLGPIFAEVFNGIWNVIVTVFGAVADIVKNVFKIFGGLIDFITGVFTGNWEKAWNGIKDIFKGVWDLIWGIIKGIVNLIIDGINLLWRGVYAVVSGIVNAIGGIAGALGKLFGQNWSFSMPTSPPLIPKLAEGGYVEANRPQLAMIGDNKHEGEIVAPESKLAALLKAAVESSKGSSITKEDLYNVLIQVIRVTGLADKFEVVPNEDAIFKVVRKKVQAFKIATNGKSPF